MNVYLKYSVVVDLSDIVELIGKEFFNSVGVLSNDTCHIGF